MIILLFYGIELLDEAYACEQVHTIILVDSNNQSKSNRIYPNKQWRSKTILAFEESHLTSEKFEEVISDAVDKITDKIDGDGVFSTLNQTKQVALRDLHDAVGSSVWCQVFKGKK